MATIIDELVTIVRLNAQPFKQGRYEVEKETDELKRKTKSSADDMTKALLDVGKSIGALFLGFSGATGFAKWLGQLNEGEAALGRTAANIGMSAHELNKWGNAVKLAGGSASEAQGAFSQLTEDFQKFNATGEQSSLLQFLRARDVAIRDQNGNLRDQGEIFEELADKTAQYGRQYQATMFRQIGLQQGYINYLVQTKQERQQLLAASERDNQVTDESVKRAQELQAYWRNIGIEIEAAGQKILTEVTPYVKAAFEWTRNMFGAFKDSGALSTVGTIFRGIWDTLKLIVNGWKELIGLFQGTAVSKYFSWLGDFYKGTFDYIHKLANPEGESSTPAAIAAKPFTARPGAYVPPADSVAGRHNNPGNLFDRSTGTERNFATLEEGQAALEADIRAKMSHGLHTVDAIIDHYMGTDPNKAKALSNYQASVRGSVGHNDVTSADIPAIAAAIARFETPGGHYAATPGVVNGGPSNRNADGTNGGSTVTVQVDKIEVNAPSADPRSVADQTAGALHRKFSVAQANTGQS